MLMIATATEGQTTPTCKTEPTFAHESSPLQTQGYFTSDIGMDGSGNVAIVGEIFGTGDIGSSYIYSLNGSVGWSQVQELNHSPQTGSDHFGASVDISTDFAIISAPLWDDEVNSINDVGAAFIFERDVLSPAGSQWSQSAKIINPGTPGNGFGGALTAHETVAIDGRLAAVSAPDATVDYLGNPLSKAGEVYVYVYDHLADQWIHEDTLTPPVPQAYARFGYSIEISGSRIIIGEPHNDPENSTGSGFAYIFHREVNNGIPTWSSEAFLLDDDLDDGDGFGWSVSIDGNGAIVGQRDIGTGSAFIYKQDAQSGNWNEVAEITPSNGQSDQRFGANVSRSGALILVGASSFDLPDPGKGNVGTAYVYQQVSGVWAESVQLHSADAGVSSDRLGETVVLARDEAFVGVLGDEPPDQVNNQQGSLLIFSDVLDCTE